MWLTIGISGVSCAGKTTLANGIRDRLLTSSPHAVNSVELIHQDSYFHPTDSPQHIWIPELDHINREHLGALDNARLLSDIQTVLATENDGDDTFNILIVEGYLIFNHPQIDATFDMRFCLDLPFEEGLERSARRRYPQPRPAGYYERFIWPLYRQHRAEYATRASTLFWCLSSRTWLRQSSAASSSADDGNDDGACPPAERLLHVLNGGGGGDDDDKESSRGRCLDEAMHAILTKLPGMPNIATTADGGVEFVEQSGTG